MSDAASRVVHCGDGVAWLAAASLDGCAVVTSMPDHSEMTLGFDGWRAWFIDTAALICRRLPDEGVAIFYQTDVKWEGRQVDKGYLVSRGAEIAGSACLFHKIVCRTAPGGVTYGRPAYAHLLAFSRDRRLEPGRSTADVLPRLGDMPWARAMGVDACTAAARFLVAEQAATTVVDPFCGHGTMLAVANQHGLDAIGVELSRKRAEKARIFELGPPAQPARPSATAERDRTDASSAASSSD